MGHFLKWSNMQKRKIFIFFSFKKKRDGPRQGVVQGKVPSPNQYIEWKKKSYTHTRIIH